MTTRGSVSKDRVANRSSTAIYFTIIAHERPRKQTVRLIFQDAVTLFHPPSSTATKVEPETKPNPTQGGTKARGQSGGQMPMRGETGSKKCEGVCVCV